MNKDICRFFQTDNATVFNAYVEGVQKVFRKSCKQSPYKTLSFSLEAFSFKYNMNGGTCIVRMIPYNNGTAVDISYSIAQLIGARYEAHERDLLRYVENKLGIRGERANIPLNTFSNSNNQVERSNSEIKFCVKCGTARRSGANFCVNCGNKF